MKKFLLSATLLVAFSLTSFAGEKEILTKNEAITEVVSTEIDSTFLVKQFTECETTTYRWTTATSDGEGGIVLTFHKATLVICDDGFIAVV